MANGFLQKIKFSIMNEMNMLEERVEKLVENERENIVEIETLQVDIEKLHKAYKSIREIIKNK